MAEIDVERTIAHIVRNHTQEAEEEAGFIAFDIRIALGLPEVIEVER